MPDLRQLPTLSLGLHTGTATTDFEETLETLRASKEVMWIFDTETLAFLEVNEAAMQRYGYTREEVLRMTILDIRPVEDVALILRDELRDRKHYAHGELWRHKTLRGKVFNVRVTSKEITFRGRTAEIVTARMVNPRPSGFSGLR